MERKTRNRGYLEGSSLECSVAERLPLYGLPDDVESLVLQERIVPVKVGVDSTARLKIVDSCGMTCTFCHNEGTPVAAAFKNGNTLLPNPTYRGASLGV